jgi:VPDSG-CTERM motif
MKMTAKHTRITWLAAVASMVVGYNAFAMNYTLNVDQLVSGTVASGTTTPYMTAVISDVSSGVVNVTLTASGLTSADSYEQHIKNVYFNLDSSFLSSWGAGNMSVLSQWSGGVAPTILTDPANKPGQNNPQLGSGPTATANYFDFVVGFADGEHPKEFAAGDAITLQFSATGLDAADFIGTDGTMHNGSTDTGTLYLGITIEDGSSATAGSLGPDPVPDAGSSASLLGLALVGMGGLSRKLKKA